jgi:hypothetical protein
MRQAIRWSTFWFSAAIGLAQVAPNTPAQRGVQPNAVYGVSDLDSVNLRSGNLTVQIPLAARRSD